MKLKSKKGCYHFVRFVHTILFNTLLSVYHFVPYRFVRSPLFSNANEIFCLATSRCVIEILSFLKSLCGWINERHWKLIQLNCLTSVVIKIR